MSFCEDHECCRVFPKIASFCENIKFLRKSQVFAKICYVLNLIFRKIRVFANIWSFFMKFLVFAKISSFRQNFEFSPKFRIFAKISSFRQNFEFLPKFRVFAKISNSYSNQLDQFPNIQFAAKICFVCQSLCSLNFTFWPKFRSYEKYGTNKKIKYLENAPNSKLFYVFQVCYDFARRLA